MAGVRSAWGRSCCARQAGKCRKRDTSRFLISKQDRDGATKPNVRSKGISPASPIGKSSSGPADRARRPQGDWCPRPRFQIPSPNVACPVPTRWEKLAVALVGSRQLAYGDGRAPWLHQSSTAAARPDPLTGWGRRLKPKWLVRVLSPAEPAGRGRLMSSLIGCLRARRPEPRKKQEDAHAARLKRPRRSSAGSCYSESLKLRLPEELRVVGRVTPAWRRQITLFPPSM